MYISVVVNKSNDALDKSFSYTVPENLEGEIKKYKRVIVPFGRGNKPLTAIITEIFDKEPEFDFKLKDIISVVDDKPFINDDDADVAGYISKITGANFVDSLKLFFPPVSFDSILSGYKKNTEFDDSGIFSNDILIDEKKIRENREKLSKWEDEGLIRQFFKLKNEPKIKTEKVLIPTGKVSEDLTERQEEIFKEIQKKKYTKAQLKSTFGVSDSVINQLIKKNFVKIVEVEVAELEDESESYLKISLNADQQRVYDGILDEYRNKKQNNFLLRGITGSGKTEVYLQLVEEVLKEGKNAIILVPEIGLTPQTVRRFKGRFKEDIAIIHSRLNKTERFREWMKIKNQEVRIVVGARSAVFSPLKNIGIIIIDEEHDSSYVSGKTPRYKTVDVARYRVKKDDGILLLGSATPSITTYFESSKGLFSLYELDKRANGRPIPEIEVADMREELNEGNTSIFSLKLYEAILDNLEKKEQVILFLNRRGFFGSVSCRSCGESIKCEHCDVSMTYHKRENLLICHYCGRTKRYPESCPVCGSKKIKEFGIGTEQVEDITRKTFPNARVQRMDRDTTARKNAHSNIYNEMNEGKIDILIGTQMIAKGLDFKNVTLVGILAADMALRIQDYRAPEWTYSLIRQVAGRSGRGDKDGRVILQTYQPDHYAIDYSVKSSYTDFYRKEILIRDEFKYPPFYNIIVLKNEGADNNKTYNDLKDIYDKVYLELQRVRIDAVVLHPNPCPISKINGVYRWQFMVKVRPELLNEMLDYINSLNLGDVTVNVDPINMM